MSWKGKCISMADKLWYIQEGDNLDSATPYVRQNIKYQGWALGGCSMASLWSFTIRFDRFTDKEWAAFIACFQEVRRACSEYNPKRVFAMMPKPGECDFYPGFRAFKDKFWPEVEPVYCFENKSHHSTEQQLFDLDTTRMDAWLENYYAQEEARRISAAGGTQPAKPAVDYFGGGR